MGILNGQESSGENLPLLPAGVQLVTYRLNESLLELEFNADYSNISRTREILVRAGVARTFLQIPGITGIKIFIGNQELTDSKGQAVGLLDGNTFVEMWALIKMRIGMILLLCILQTRQESILWQNREMYIIREFCQERE